MGRKIGALSGSQFKGIGKVATQWSYLEFVLQFKIWLVLNVQTHVGMIITAEMQAVGLITLLRMLLMHTWEFDPRLKRVKALLEEIDALRIERNKAVHLVHARTEKGVLTIKVKRDPGLQRPKQFTANELKEISKKISNACEELKKTQLPVVEPMSPKILKALSGRYGWKIPSSDPTS